MAQTELGPSSAHAVEHPGSLEDIVVEELTRARMDRRFPAGERLVETRGAALLGDPRSPLREALARLEAEGPVESRHGRGTFVVVPTSEDFMRMVPVCAGLKGPAARLVAGSGGPCGTGGVQRGAEGGAAGPERPCRGRPARPPHHGRA